MEKKKDTSSKIYITEQTRFDFVYYENAVNVATALAMAGFYINIKKDGSKYIVKVYTDRI